MDRKKSMSFRQSINKESTAGVVFSLPFIIGFLAQYRNLGSDYPGNLAVWFLNADLFIIPETDSGNVI